VLQRVAAFCSVLQRVAESYDVVPRIAETLTIIPNNSNDFGLTLASDAAARPLKYIVSRFESAFAVLNRREIFNQQLTFTF